MQLIKGKLSFQSLEYKLYLLRVFTIVIRFWVRLYGQYSGLTILLVSRTRWIQQYSMSSSEMTLYFQLISDARGFWLRCTPTFRGLSTNFVNFIMCLSISLIASNSRRYIQAAGIEYQQLSYKDSATTFISIWIYSLFPTRKFLSHKIELTVIAPIRAVLVALEAIKFR